MTQQQDAFDFMNWFLNELHFGLGGKRNSNGSSIIHRIFQGKIQIESQRIIIHQLESKKVFDKDRGMFYTVIWKGKFNFLLEIITKTCPFLFLTLDLPPSPLFKDEIEKNIIPQVSLFDLLSKYDGETSQESDNLLKRFKILQLPLYLIIVIKRFTRTNFTIEKNPTIVHFPIKGLNMKDCKIF